METNNKDYFVLYKRDLKTEKSKQYKSMMLYDNMKTFETEADARTFGFRNLPAIVVTQNMIHTQQASSQSKYVVAALFEGKYKHYDYGGGCDWLTNFDVLRCQQSQLEQTINQFAGQDHFKKVYVGLELKLF